MFNVSLHSHFVCEVIIMWFSIYRPIKDSQLRQEDVNGNETSFFELKTKLDAWQFYQFKTQYPLDKWTVSSLPNLYFTDVTRAKNSNSFSYADSHL